MPYWLFIVIGISLLGGVILSLCNKRNWDYMFTSIAIFIGLIFLLGFPTMSLTADSPRYSQRYKENIPIYSLRTNELVSGSFSLGCGNIENKTYYIYYTRDTDGSYSINKLEASKCKIFMDRESGGVLTNVWGVIDDKNLSDHWGLEEYIFSHYEFHLPYGSLIQEYSVR